MKRPTHARQRPPTWRSLVVIVSFAAALAVYLFVNAPPPLAAGSETGARIPIRTVFAMLDHENATARALWAEEIVGKGSAVGLTFDEHWRDDGVNAGPLPALFLRETARNLQRTPLHLSLFLGSQFPINPANQLTGDQATHFAVLAGSKAPQFFADATTGLQTAMFADVAVSDACVACHNDHAGSPKIDWQVHDVMGATTWMYPEASVTTERAVELVRALRASIRQAYADYLAKVATFPTRPTIGTSWPRDGFALPSEDVFMSELARRSSPSTLLGLLDPSAPLVEAPAALPGS
jgi:adenylate cyclase